MQLTFKKKITYCAKRQKKITCHEEKSKPPPGYHMVRPLVVSILHNCTLHSILSAGVAFVETQPLL